MAVNGILKDFLVNPKWFIPSLFLHTPSLFPSLLLPSLIFHISPFSTLYFHSFSSQSIYNYIPDSHILLGVIQLDNQASFLHFSDKKNITDKLEQILNVWGRRLLDYDMRKSFNKREARMSYAYSNNFFGWGARDESWYRIAVSVFSGIWQCYLISTIKWRESIKDIHSALLNTLPVSHSCHFQSIES
jgi:hypothetical protein